MKTVFISVSGETSSDRSSFADLIAGYYGNRAAIIRLDNYYHDFSSLPLGQRVKIKLDDPASMDFALVKTHILAIKNGEHIQSPIYDFTKLARSDQVETIAPCELIVVDGSLLLHHDDIADLFDYKIHMDAYDNSKADFIVNGDANFNFISTDTSDLLDRISVKTGLPKYHRQSPNVVTPSKKFTRNTEVSGTLYVISGPSGVGKSTIISRLISTNNRLSRVIPYTTREKRPSETEGVDYNFVSHEQYEEFIKKPVLNDMAIFNNHFFIPLERVTSVLEKGSPLIIDLLPQSLAQVKLHKLKIKTIFICPPEMAALSERLIERDGSTTDRFTFSVKLLEDEEYVGYDYLVINDNLDEAVAKVACIIQSSELTLTKQLDTNKALFDRFRVHSVLEQAKKSVPELEGLKVDACTLTPLSGLSNHSYRLDWNNKSYFLRASKKGGNAFQIGPEIESAHLAILARNNFYPNVLFYDKTTRAYMTKYLLDYEMLTPEKAHASSIIIKLANLIAELHQLRSDELTHRYSPQQITESVILYLKRYKTFPAQFYNNLTVLCRRVDELLRRNERGDEVFCHGDMTPFNIMYKENPDLDIKFADWELSGLNDRYWDLAKLSVECHFNDKEDVDFLTYYFGRAPSERDLLKLFITKLQVQYVLSVWAMLQWHIANPDDPKLSIYLFIYKTRIDNCKKILASDRYTRGITCLNKPEGALEFPIVVYSFEHSVLHHASKDEGKQTLRKKLHSMRFFNQACNSEQTLVLLKPDLMLRGNLEEEAMEFFQQRGFSIVDCKTLVMTQEQIETLYPKINYPENQKIFYDVIDLMTLGPVMALILECKSAVSRAIKMKGATNPKNADDDTFRKKFGISSKYNSMHCSDTVDDAKREIQLFFGDLSASMTMNI